MDTANIERRLNSFAKQVVKDSRALLEKDKGSTALGKSIKFEVTKESNGFSTKFYMADYGEYLDKGVSGNEKKRSYTDYFGKNKPSPGKGYTNKHPPTGIIEKWIKRKGIKGRDKKSGRFIKNKSFAFAIAKSIQKKGIKSLSFFQKPLGLQFRKLEKDMLKILTLDIRSYLTEFYRPK